MYLILFGHNVFCLENCFCLLKLHTVTHTPNSLCPMNSIFSLIFQLSRHALQEDIPNSWVP